MRYNYLSLLIIAWQLINFGLINAVNNSNNNEWYIQNNTEHVEPKIVGGYHDPNSKWAKYTVSLRRINQDTQIFGSGHFCGGSIISVYTILTAAHCFVEEETVANITNTRNIYIVIGNIYRLQFQKSAQTRRISRVIIHPGYDSIYDFNDIALIILKREIIIDDKHTGIIRLPSGPLKPNTVCTAAGWGRQYEDGPLPDEILYVHLKVLTVEDCFQRVVIKDSKKICARDVNDLVRDTCTGDSGGPLYANDTIVAITSLGPRCGDLSPRGSGAYTHVYLYVDWIKWHYVRNSCFRTKFYFHTLFCSFFSMYRFFFKF